MQKFVMWISVIAVVTLAVLNLTFRFGPEPDETYAMANQHIDWTYAGK